MTTKLNRRERKAQQLLAHYDRCEKLARHLGAANPDGKKISVALFKIERDASNAATAQPGIRTWGNESHAALRDASQHRPRRHREGYRRAVMNVALVVGEGWTPLRDGEPLRNGDGYFWTDLGIWIDYDCRPDLFRGEKEYVHSGYQWRRKV